MSHLKQHYDRGKLEQEFDNLPEASPIADIDPFKGDIIAMVGALSHLIILILTPEIHYLISGPAEEGGPWPPVLTAKGDRH